MQAAQTISPPTMHLSTAGLTALRPSIQKPIPGFPELTIDNDMVVRYVSGPRAGDVVDNRWRPAGKSRPHIRVYIGGREYERDVVELYQRAFGKRQRRVLTDNAVRHIRAMYAAGVAAKDIARANDIHAATVYQIARGAVYKNVN